MKEREERRTEGSWAEVEETAPPIDSADRSGPTEVTDENGEANNSQALGKATDYSENSNAYPPEVLRLLEVICEVIMEAASVDTSHTE